MFGFLGYAVRVAQATLREHVGKRKRRSSKWPGVRKRALLAHPMCSSCGGKRMLHVHHSKPFHLFPALELEPTNLMVLCMSRKECHLRIGHGGDWDAYNPNVQADVLAVIMHPKARINIEMRARSGRKYSE